MDFDFDDDAPESAVVVTEPDDFRSVLHWRSSIRIAHASGAVTEHRTPKQLLPVRPDQRLDAVAEARSQLVERFGIEAGMGVLRTYGGQNECTVWHHPASFQGSDATVLLKQSVHGLHAMSVSGSCVLRVIPRSTTFLVQVDRTRLLWLSLAKRETKHLDLDPSVDGEIVDVSDDVRTVTIRTRGTDRLVPLRKLQRSATPGLPDDMFERSMLTDALDKTLGHSNVQQAGRHGRDWWAIVSARHHQHGVDVALRDANSGSLALPDDDIALAGHMFTVGRNDSPTGFQDCAGHGRRIGFDGDPVAVGRCPICGWQVDDNPGPGHPLEAFPGACDGVFSSPVELADRHMTGICRVCDREQMLTPIGLIGIHARPATVTE